MDTELQSKAVSIRLKRMRDGLGWSALWATVFEQFVRNAASSDELVGLNLLIFALLSVTVFYMFRDRVQLADTSSFAWRMKSPWQLVYWPLALVFIVILQIHRDFTILLSAAFIVLVIGLGLRAAFKKVSSNPRQATPALSDEIATDGQMLLSKLQRNILVAVAALISFVLVVQIEEEGLRDSPWLVGLLAIGGLLLLAFAPSRK